MLSPSLAQTLVTVPDHVLTRVVGGSLVILDVDSGRSFTLDETGSRVWTLLAETGSAQATYEALLREFDADPKQLADDLRILIAQLADGRLLDLQFPSA
jgi:hypothetical protein